MPLKPGSDKDTIAMNVRELINSGRTPRQAKAIAMEHAEKTSRRKKTSKKKTSSK